MRVDHLIHPMTYNELVKNPKSKKMKLVLHCGIYFLIDKKTVVYVGQSNNIMSRISGHSVKKYTSIIYIECDKEELDKLETDYIIAFNPKYNKTHDSAISINKYRLKNIDEG